MVTRCSTEVLVQRMVALGGTCELQVLLVAVLGVGKSPSLPSAATVWADETDQSYSAEQAAEDRRASLLEAMYPY